MAAVVLVHGAFNELWGPNEIKARWLPALRDGLLHAGATVADDDVAVGFYGDLFRRRSTPARAKRSSRPGPAWPRCCPACSAAAAMRSRRSARQRRLPGPRPLGELGSFRVL